MAEAEKLKHDVAAKALEFVRDGMRLGLGTGTTATVFVQLLGDRVKAGLSVTCVPTSEATRLQAEGLGLTVTTLDELPELDLTIDGADEFDGDLRLIKGGGGALLREKIVAAASASMVVIADRNKAVERLGAFPLPVEVNAFGLASTRLLVTRIALDMGMRDELTLRMGRDGKPFVTDGGHHIIDCRLGPIADPVMLARRLNAVPGVVEHGLFLDFASAIVTNDESGGVRIVERRPASSFTH